ncbi:surface-adhesin E family protein [Cupriavidus taiwanensis]|uniref:Surface-adhesin protein E-like domain-containing protein n=1 Tax=Cupriavidus taiwanensis TaxID=164546 RepID=A0A7Z7NQ11_9BURK|nr:surface-adhesin E family protein [Cupriavidus taiwanensis]SOZ17163.1 exported hypothetical protein [Cupriavidus taiwanensis]SOZ96527.1 exported hypothetical protein [Cupriavidus taiwanensis]SPC25546.1 exported hypothetical protein [Cupriavidus taiwanensis]
MNKTITAILAASILSAPLFVHAEWVPVNKNQSVLINNEQFVVNGDKRMAFVKFKGEKGDKYGSVIFRTTFDCTNMTTLDTYRASYDWKGKVVYAGNLYEEPSPTIPGTLGANMLKAVCSKSGGGVDNAADSGEGSGGNALLGYSDHAQTNLPASIPNLSNYDNETRRTIELACISERSNGPVAYGACLNRQIAALQGSPGIPNLSGYDNEVRRTMELACISERSNGPVAYGACLNYQIASLQGSPGIPNLSGYDNETRRTMELACISERSNGPVAYGTCLNRQIASLRGSPSIPNLSGYDNEVRRSMELACISERSNGPVAYGACLNRQIASLQGSPGIPNLSGYDNETRRTMELACISERSNGPVAYGACLRKLVR